MIKSVTKKCMALLLSAIFASNMLVWFGFAQENFEIIDEASNPAKVLSGVKAVWSQWWRVWDNYDATAKWMDTEADLWNQLASGIMTWNTLLRYAVKLVRWLSQVWLLIWALMIVYAGYLYATEIFVWKSWDGNKAIKNAIIWVLVISFSYAIMKLITSAFL